MAPEFSPAAGVGAWQIGTPPVLGAAALYGALAISREAGIEAIRAKSLDPRSYLMAMVDELEGLGYAVGTPREAERRGGHVAVEHAEAVRIAKALKARGIVPDFRPPNVIRLAPIPPYTTYAEVRETVRALREIVETGAHLRFEATRETVA